MSASQSLWYLFRKLLKPILFFALIILGMSFLMFPWAIPLPGRETLSGDWMGPLRASRGPDAGIFLSLQPKSSLKNPWKYVFPSAQYDSPAGAPLQGRAMLCTKRLGRVDFDVNGYTTAWSGETLNILVTPRSSSGKGPRFRMNGRWSGTTLELLEEGNNLDEALGEPGLGGNNLEDWIKAEMHKGGESDWLAMCANLR